MKEEKERVGTGKAHPNKLITHSKFKASSECYPDAMTPKRQCVCLGYLSVVIVLRKL